MKVLIFNHAFFYISETFIYQQVKGMPGDIEVALMGFDFPNEKVFPLNNKKIIIKWSANFIDKIIAGISKRIPGSRNGLGLFSRNKVKKIIEENKVDLIHAHFGFNALTILPVAKALNIPMVVTFHGVDASPQYLNKNSYRKAINELLAYSAAIIIVSPHMIDTLVLKSLSHKTHLISCGVDTDKFQNVPASEKPGVINILHSGRLVSKKGVPDLIRVFIALNQKYHHIRLHIIGEGPELQLCKQLATGGNPDNITFYGAKPHDEVKKMMGNTHIFVLNSRVSDSGDMEGLPVSILEAMSMRIAVVSTRHAGIPYLITNEINGLLADEKNNNQLFAAIEKLIIDSALRKQIGEAARERVMKGFTVEKINRGISEVYRQIAEVHRKAISN